MNYKYIVSLIVLFGLGSIHSLVAQQEITAYTIPNIPYMKQLNPASPLEKKLEISLFNFNSSMDMVGPTFEDIGDVSSDHVLVIDKDRLINSLSDNNVLNINTSLQTINVGFRIKGIEFDMGHAIRQQTHMVYPKTLAELFVVGNSDYIGETMSLGIKSSLTSFHQFNLGVSGKIKNLHIGVNVKFLNGLINFTTTGSQLDLHTSDDIYQLDLTADYVINSSRFVSLEDINIFDDFKFYGSNFGLAFDFGLKYKINDKWKLSASILDIGSISWTDEVTNFSLDRSVTFNGLKLTDLINDKETISIQDTLKAFFEFEESNNNYKSKLSSSLYISAQYQQSERLSFSTVYYRQMHEHFSSNVVALGVHFQRRDFVGMGLTYSIRDGHYNNLGISTNVSLGAVRFFMASDNILGFILPDSSRHLNGRIGGSLVF